MTFIFADGIAEDIITELSRYPDPFVVARNSSFTYRGKAALVTDATRELGVRYVLEGSMRRAGNRVRIGAQLIDATDGTHLWAQRFDRNLEDPFSVQDEVTQSIQSESRLRRLSAQAGREASRPRTRRALRVGRQRPQGEQPSARYRSVHRCHERRAHLDRAL
jgi:adenylate cyclase